MGEALFLEQIQMNQGILYKLVGLYANDAEEKKDLYQEVLLQAWKSWQNFRNESKFSTWLYRICLNTILTQQRKSRKITYKETLEDIAPAIQNGIIEKEEVVRLRLAIRQLAETDRAIVSLHLDGFDNAAISEIVGISVNHVAVKMHRIKQQLGNLLIQ